MNHLIIFFSLILAAEASAEDRAMYFLDTSRPAEHVPLGDTLVTVKLPERIDLELEIRTLSVEEQNQFAPLVIDDYRYDEPNYFVDHRVPNVGFEVMVKRKGVFTSIPFRVSPQGGGATLQYLDVHVSLEIGGNPDKFEAETMGIYKLLVSKQIKEEEAIEKLKAVQTEFAPNRPGVYRVRALYRPNVPGKWRGELAMQSLTIIIPGNRKA